MKIWLHINGEQVGPFEPDRLPLDQLTPDTPVWYDGLPQWMRAADAPETARLLARAAEEPHAADEPITRLDLAVQPERQPRSYIGWSIALTVLFTNPIGIFPIFTGAKVISRRRNLNFDGARRASITTEWWLMILIVTTLVSLPFSLLL